MTGRLALIGAPSLLIYMALTYLISNVLHLSGWRLWAFRLALWLLGLVAFGLIYWFTKKSADAKAEEEADDDELESLLATARARLASSPTIEVAALNRLPLVLVLGPTGSAKTSTIVNSGLDPDLLAGAARQGDQVAPTSTGNLWYAHNTILLEAGRAFNDDPSRWRRLIRAIRPQTLGNVLSGRPQAPRVAVACLSCEALLGPDASTAIPRIAQQLRSVLVDLAHGFGTPLPVYVLFTKADRIPHFAEYVANLKREEAEEVLGATLRWPTAREAGRSAEQEYQRINGAFQRLFASLAEKRLRLLPREAVGERKASAYEFPREFRKIGPLATQFMVDLCRPSQLRISPVLRGFYFSGVRAVVVSDAGTESQPEPAMSDSGRIAATEVFNVGRRQAPAAAAGVGPRERKVPQWLFLGRLFRDVIGRDRMAMGVTRSGTHLTLRRRLVMGSAVALSLLLSSCFTLSYIGNKRLERRAVSAAAGLLDVRSREPELPTYESLQRLETLREQIDRLAEYERAGPPLRLRWGLYRGDDLLPPVRSLYLERLDHLILQPARLRLADSLRALPAVPAEDAAFERTYALLKAYLMTTIETGRIDSTFLAPRLWNGWLEGRPIDDERETLARRQLDFFAGPLCDAESLPCAEEADRRAVMRACTYLRGFSGPERYYQLMIARAASGIGPIRFSAVYPNAAGIIANDYVVPGAFTPEGWETVHAEIRSMDELAEAEAWVCEETAPSVDRAALASTLLERYHRDYLQHWRSFISAARVVRFGSTRQAGTHLGELAGNESPLLKLLALVARSTRLEDEVIDSAFQPVHIVTPPEITDRFVSEANQSYINALIELQGLVDQARSSGPGSEAQLLSDTRAAARKAEAEVLKLTQNFRIEGAAREVGGAVRNLLQQPVDNVEGLLLRLPAARINAAGASFCSDISGLMGKYPFNPRAVTPASLDEVSDVFQPGSGLLWRFYDEWLADILVERGSVYGPAPGAAMRPRQSYVDFFNQAARLSRTLWSEDDREPGFSFTLKPTLSSSLPTVRFAVDGRPYNFSRTRIRTEVIRWAGRSAGSAVLSGEVRGREQDLLRYDGTWALFKLFGEADWQRAGQKYTVRWRLEPQGEILPLEAEVDLGGKPPILQAAYFAGLRNCVARIVP